MKRFLSLLVALALVLSLAPAAFAEEATPVELSEAEATVTNEGTGSYIWYFNGSRILNVFGSGEFSVIYNGVTTASEYEMVSMTIEGSFWMPAQFQIVGDGEFYMYIAEPAGSMGNPEHLTDGENVATIAEGSQGYFYTWIASNNGTLSLSISADAGWTYAVDNVTAGTYGDIQWSDSDPVVDSWTVEVTSGDELQIMVNTYDPANMWTAPAGEIVLTASFAPAGPAVYENVHTPVAGVSVPANLEKVDITKAHTAVMGADGYLHLDAADGPVLYAKMVNECVDLTTIGGAFSLVAYIGGVKTDIKEAMVAYSKALDANGYYPLTADLQMFLQVYGANQGWYMAGLSPIEGIGSADPSSAWMFCCYTEAVEEDGECKHENLVHMEAVEPGCHMDGNIEHWYCTACETVWQDEALTQITNHKNVVLPATGEGLLVHMDAVEPACHYEGNVEYWVCYTCEQVWTDEALTQKTNIKNVVLPAIGGEVAHLAAIEPGCHDNGNIEHWLCKECGQVWADEALTQLTNRMNVILPATGEGLLVHMDAVEPACHYTGNIEHWICYSCEKVWTDEALTQDQHQERGRSRYRRRGRARC